MNENRTRAGRVALLGRPNVGKSTLLNALLGQKLSITSPRPQTTRHNLLGIKTQEEVQIVYVDTPGLHTGGRKALNRYMNRTAVQALEQVDVVVFLVETLRWSGEDEAVLKHLEKATVPVIAAISKIDRLKDRAALLPFMETLAQRHEFAHIVPLSARKHDNLDTLERAIAELLPPAPFPFDEDELTTASQRFLAAELIREKLFRQLRDEVPYALTVEIERFEETPTLDRIHAVIWVERPGQKAIVIGAQGHTLREVGRQARIDMEALFGRKVYLQTWVKVRSDWADDEQTLTRLGYHEP